MHRLYLDVMQRMTAVPGAATLFAQNGGVRFVYDHVKYHDRAATYLNALPWHQRVATPPWSPDFNRPVERAFGTIKRAYKENEVPLTSPNLMQAMKDRVDALARSINVSSVRRDVESMPLLLKVIASDTNQQVQGPDGKSYKGVAGGWPPCELR